MAYKAGNMASPSETNIILEFVRDQWIWIVTITAAAFWWLIRLIGMGLMERHAAHKKRTLDLELRIAKIYRDSATRDEMKECQELLGHRIDSNFHMMREDNKEISAKIETGLRDVHARVDDVNRTMNITKSVQYQEWLINHNNEPRIK